MRATGYDIDALLAIEGSDYDKIHPIYLAISNVDDRSALTEEELCFHDAQFFRDYLTMSGFSRFCEPEYVAEFAAALNGFERMETRILESFCSEARMVLRSVGLLDAEDFPDDDLDLDYEESERIGESLSDQYREILGSSEVDAELLQYLIRVSPQLRKYSAAPYLWTWTPDVVQGYGGKSETIPNPNKDF